MRPLQVNASNLLKTTGGWMMFFGPVVVDVWARGRVGRCPRAFPVPSRFFL